MEVKNISFGARVNVDYSRRSGEMKPVVEKAATYLRKVGNNEIIHNITARKDFIRIETKVDFGGEEYTHNIGKVDIKGKKTSDEGFILRLLKVKKYLKNIKEKNTVEIVM